MSKKNDLLSTEQAAETLGLDEAEVDELIESGDLRKIWHRAGNSSEAPLDSFVLGADVDRALKDKDPRHLARLVRDGADPDDPESPKNLAAQMPRL